MNGRKVTDTVTAGGTTYALTHYSYDTLGRIDCTAQRLNPATYGSLPASACTLGTAGAAGPDRISKVSYDALSRPIKTTAAYGTADQSDDATLTYTADGLTASVADANNNLTSYEYDGFNRLVKTRYPVATQGALASSASDYEQLTYDVRGNVTQRRLRDGQIIGYAYDLLGRTVSRDLPGTEVDSSYSYDLLRRLTLANDGNGAASYFSYDALGRKTAESAWVGLGQTYQYDSAGRRTRTSWGDGFYVTYDYDVIGNVTAIRENGATSGVGVLASYTYDNLGRRTSLVRGNGSATYYGFDAVSRLTCLTQDMVGSGTPNCTPTALGQDAATTFSYNPASQIASTARANDAYAWTGSVNVDRPYTSNGLNQYSSAGAVTFGYDARGNLNRSGTTN